MTIRATSTQKAKIRQLLINCFTNQRTRSPADLHVVVVPGLTPIHAEICSGIDEFSMAESVTGRVRQHRQAAGRMNGPNHRISPQRLTHGSIAAVVRLQCRMIQFEAEGQDVDEEASVEKQNEIAGAGSIYAPRSSGRFGPDV